MESVCTNSRPISCLDLNVRFLEYFKVVCLSEPLLEGKLASSYKVR